MKKILFFDILSGGHHGEYILHLVRYFSSHNPEWDPVFVINSELFIKNAQLKKELEGARFMHHLVSEEEFSFARSGNIFRRSINTYKLLELYTRRLEVDQVYLMSLNSFQLALILYRSTFSIHGILFMQFTRVRINTLTSALNYYRKYFTTMLLVRNSRLKTIHILNDVDSVVYLNRKFKTNIFKELPDPIDLTLSDTSNTESLKGLNINENDRLVLHLGNLAERKGTIEAIQSLSFVTSKNVKFIIGGVPESHTMGKRINEEVNNLQRKGMAILYLEGFLESNLMQALFQRASVVLIPYKKPEGSSGILGHSAKFKVPVVASKEGLVGELVRACDLGVTIESISPEIIGDAIDEILAGNYSTSSKFHQFLNQRTPDQFAETILDEIRSLR